MREAVGTSAPKTPALRRASIHVNGDPPKQPEDQHGGSEVLRGGSTQSQDGEAVPGSRSDAFWNVNLPPAEHTKECPDFLRYALDNQKDQRILSTLDADYQRQSWTAVQQLIRHNRLDLFMRVPSELRLYREYCAKLVREYGSIMEFVMQERLRWEKLSTSGPPFSSADDYRILYNDWPYGVDERIVHLVIWTKFELPVDPTSPIGDMTAETRRLVCDFVDVTFVKNCGNANVIWFKNWGSLKSIHAVEHFHVMLYDPNMDFVRTVTNGDVPLFRKVKQEKQLA